MFDGKSYVSSLQSNQEEKEISFCHKLDYHQHFKIITDRVIDYNRVYSVVNNSFLFRNRLTNISGTLALHRFLLSISIRKEMELFLIKLTTKRKEKKMEKDTAKKMTEKKENRKV